MRLTKRRFRLCWRPGNWLFAIHPCFTLKPNIEDYDECGWAVWWLWFEVAHVSLPTSDPQGERG